jgi:hypothetical protein
VDDDKNWELADAVNSLANASSSGHSKQEVVVYISTTMAEPHIFEVLDGPTDHVCLVHPALVDVKASGRNVIVGIQNCAFYCRLLFFSGESREILHGYFQMGALEFSKTSRSLLTRIA